MSKKKYCLRSMTAYGRGESDGISVEMQSINRRHRELSLNLPKDLSSFEMPIRKLVAERVGRGQISILVRQSQEGVQALSVRPNLPLAKQIKGALVELAEAVGIAPQIELAMLTRVEGVLEYGETENPSNKKAIITAVSTSLDALEKMKEVEGEALAKDLEQRVELLRGYVEQIEALASGVADRYREKLVGRMEELLESSEALEERLLREIALYAEKSDVTEELVRLKSHLQQFLASLYTPFVSATEVKGKRLDFLVQEILREFNTIGSKASDLEISKLVIEAKSDLEKIREQVQNVE